MKKSGAWLAISLFCIVAGAALLLISGVRSDGDLKNALSSSGSGEKQEEKSVTVKENFSGIRVLEADADVRLLSSPDGVCRVVYGESESSRCRVEVNGDTLQVIRETDGGASIGFHFSSDPLPVRIYLPGDQYRALTVETASGNVEADRGFVFGTVEIQTASGDVRLQDLRGDSLRLTCSSGEISLRELQVQKLRADSTSGALSLEECVLGTLELHSTSGEILLDKVTADRLETSSTSGDQKMKACSLRSLSLESSSGELKLKSVLCFEAAQIRSSSGNVKLEDCDAASFDIETTSGEVEGTLLSEKDFLISTASGSVHTDGGRRGAAECRVRTTSGDVDLRVAR